MKQNSKSAYMTMEEFCSNISVRPEVLGAHVIISHFPSHTSSQRLLMFNNSASQIEVIIGNETARFQTGYETKYGRYEFDDASRDQDVQILAVIPKFGLGVGTDQIRTNPSYTVVYVGCDDGKVGYFTINEYTELHNGFGYKNKQVSKTFPSEGDFVAKEQKFVTAPNHDGDMYNLGLNANVAYIPMWDTTDDAFVISDELAKKFTHTVIAKREISIGVDECPLNLYGDDESYKCFPDIGDTVRDDGILLALRKFDSNSFSTDLTNEELYIPRQLHDNIIMAQPGATVTNIDVYVAHRVMKNSSSNSSFYKQIMTYALLHNKYYSAIIDIYNKEVAGANRTCNSAFNTLVTRCKCLCYRTGNRMILVDKKDEIQNMKLVITYAYEKKISLGCKLTGTDGSKGVVSAIWPKEDMPISIHGVRADILITAESPFNRLNGGQFIEQFLSLCSEIVARNVKEGNVPDKDAYEYVLDYIRMVNPNFSEYIRRRLTTKALRDDFIQAVKDDGIYMIVPPYMKGLNADLYLAMCKKYGIERGPLTYYRHKSDGTREKVVTKCPGIIGAKYLVLLGKRPEDTLTAAEFGYVNQFFAPMKVNNKHAKLSCLHAQTPQKYGEDEFANLITLIGPVAASRILGVYGNSPVAMAKLQQLLLESPYPTALGNIGMTTKEIMDNCSNIGLLNHMLCEVGYQLKDYIGAPV